MSFLILLKRMWQVIHFNFQFASDFLYVAQWLLLVCCACSFHPFPQNRTDAYFPRGQRAGPALPNTEPQPVKTDGLTWMKSNQDGRRRTASEVNGVQSQQCAGLFRLRYSVTAVRPMHTSRLAGDRSVHTTRFSPSGDMTDCAARPLKLKCRQIEL